MKTGRVRKKAAPPPEEREAPIQEAIERVRRRTHKQICVEVDNMIEFRHALESEPDIILLDNMDCARMRKAVGIRNAQKKLCRPSQEGDA